MMDIIKIFFNLKTIVIGAIATIMVIIGKKNNKIEEQKEDIIKKDVQIENDKVEIETIKNKEKAKNIAHKIKEEQVVANKNYEEKEKDIDEKINNMKDGDEVTITV